MTKPPDVDESRFKDRKDLLRSNIFSRLPATYAASRTQGQRLLQAGGGLSIVEWRTLWDLHEAGPMTIQQLSDIQQADHSLLSRALPEMRRKGFVTMARGSRDGRQTIVSLAQAGREAYEKAAPIMARRRAALRDIFSPEDVKVFTDYLDRLDAFLRLPIEDIINDGKTPE